MFNKINLPTVEIFITNVCNLNCTGCDTFSNYQFSSKHDSWKTWEPIYKKWSEIIDTDEVLLIGGEPLAHPDCVNWAQGLRQLWPNAKIRILTNGTLLGSKTKHLENLYQVCKDNNIMIRVTMHNKNTTKNLIDQVHAWLSAPLLVTMRDDYVLTKSELIAERRSSYQIIKQDHWPKCESLEDWRLLDDRYKNECVKLHNFTFDVFDQEKFNINLYQRVIDSNNVVVDIQTTTEFDQGMLRADPETQTFSLNDSDPIQAHQACHIKFCHQFYQGKLYKCSFIHSVQEFYEQFYLNMSNNDLDLINSYKPAELEWSIEQIKEFVENLKDPIAQCKFCTPTVKRVEFNAEVKKIKFLKKQKTRAA